jgi:hypothetical protein
MKHRLTHIDQVLMTNDGRHATLRLLTESAAPFALEIETARLAEIICQLLAIARAAGEALGANPEPQVGSPVHTVPIETSGAGVMLGPQGHTLLVVRVGCIDLALEIENSRTKSIGHELVLVGTSMEAEPKLAQ